jgi:hypothetical protein
MGERNFDHNSMKLQGRMAGRDTLPGCAGTFVTAAE